MCVSTGKAGRPIEKSSTIAAVLGPTPLNFISQARASSKRHILEKIQFERAAFAGDLPQDLLDAWSLLVGQTGGTDGGNHPFRFGIPDCLPGWKTLAEGRESPVTVGIIGILGEDSRDKLIHWRHGIAPGRLPVVIQQAMVHFASQLGHIPSVSGLINNFDRPVYHFSIFG